MSMICNLDSATVIFFEVYAITSNIAAKDFKLKLLVGDTVAGLTMCCSLCSYNKNTKGHSFVCTILSDRFNLPYDRNNNHRVIHSNTKCFKYKLLLVRYTYFSSNLRMNSKNLSLSLLNTN